MLNAKWLGVSLVLCGALCGNAEAKLYKWVDDSGITHYGETIPPEYANKDATKFSDKGRIEKRIEKLTPEEQRAKETEETKKSAAQQVSVEARRRDSALLNTFSNEAEIDLSRDRSLQQVEARINSITTMLKSAQDSLATLHKEQDELLKQNRKIPKSLLEDIEEFEVRVAKQQKDMAQNVQELASVKARFEADKLRYRELKGNSATTRK
jgi:predicted  nucleic acid-binding Zn-ribbon protein